MQRNKDGVIVASMTDVKNNTGDIFDIVDQYGEIILTSYNKPSYRVTKIDVTERLSLKSNSTPKVNAKSTAVVKKEVTPKSNIVEIKKENVATEETYLVSQSLMNAVSKVKFWDRNSSIESKFIQQATKKLQ